MEFEKEFKVEHHLYPPPRLMPNGELPPVIEPAVRDMASARGFDTIEEWEPFHSESPDQRLSEELVRRAAKVVLSDERVQRLLSEKRYVPIGASVLEQRGEKAAASVLYILYDYTDNVTIEVILDQEARQIVDVQKARYQPPPLQKEIDEAIELARRDSRLSKMLTDDLEGGAILVSPDDPDDPSYGHRQFDVRFGCPDERLPRHSALVDLSTRTVLRVGPTCTHERSQQGGQR